jgi:hypothetical protein
MIRKSLVLIGGALFFIGAASSAHAQESFRLDVKVPFDFQAGNRTFPAGEYLVSVSQDNEPGVLTIRSRNGHGGEFLLVEPVDTKHVSRDGRLVFEHTGDAYVLTEVFDGGATVGGEILGTHAPQEQAPAGD